MRPRLILALFFTFFAVFPVFAEDEMSEGAEAPIQGVELSGFADFYSANSAKDLFNQNFGFGQIELDLEAPLHGGISFEAGIVLDPENQSFGVGLFTIDFDIFDYNKSHLTHRFAGIDHSGFVVGQFDVPFGLDWKVYPSIDRMLITPPLVVESTHGLWNDFGIQAYTKAKYYNVVGFLLNGFGYSAAYGPGDTFLGYNGLGYDPADTSITEIETNTHYAAGGRLGITPLDPLEIGVSAAGFFNSKHHADMKLFGMDLQCNVGNLETKGEYIIHTIHSPQSDSRSNRGWYAQGLYHVTSSLYVVGRYGDFDPDVPGSQEAERVSAGIGYFLSDNVIFRAEQQFNHDHGQQDWTYLQAAIAF